MAVVFLDWGQDCHLAGSSLEDAVNDGVRRGYLDGHHDKAVETLEAVYDDLPKQLIHRDVHFGNFLFFEGNLSGYIDFDLSQRNIRIFDICYFLTGLLAEEKNAIPCVMECIEILCTAYFINIQDIKHANDAYRIFHFIQNCESDIITKSKSE